MSSTHTSELHERIRQLEADNASLAGAAEQAAVLVEEYAADAARYRSSRDSTQQSLNDEISDASRRKDRRIQRLSSLHSEEKHANQALKQRVQQLEKLTVVSDDSHSTARQASLLDLQSPLRPHSSPNPITSQFAASILDMLKPYFPPSLDVAPDFAAFQLFLRLNSVQTLSAYLTHLLPQFASLQPPQKIFVQHCLPLLADVSSVAHTATLWCSETTQNFAHRILMLNEPITSLEERTAALFSQLCMSQTPHAWTPEFTKIKTDLLAMALEVVKGVIPDTYTSKDSDAQHLLDPLRQICEQRATSVQDAFIAAADADGKANQLESKLNAARTKLRQRERDLDDLKVRITVYEDRLAIYREEVKSMASLKERALDLEKQLVVAKERAPENAPKEAQEALKMREEEAGEHKVVKVKPKEVASPLADWERVVETKHLRKLLVRTQLCDLHGRATRRREEEERIREIVQIRDAVMCGLKKAREAASKAEVVRLNSDTLQPETRGASMSRKMILQSLGATAHFKEYAKWRSEREKVYVKSEMCIRGGEEAMASAASVLRKVAGL